MWLVFILLSVFFWACCNVLDSLLVKHYEKNPIVLMWSQSVFSIIILFPILSLVPLRTTMTPWLLLGGCIGYFGDLIFFHILDRIDVSVTNIAWALLSILLTVVGFQFFGEAWTTQQTIGSILILSAVAYLSIAHHEFSFYTLMLLFGLAFFYLPLYSFQKAAFLRQNAVLPVVFWSTIGREFLAFSVPWFLTGPRRRIRLMQKNADTIYFLICFLVIAFFFTGMYLGARAYEIGALSLVSVAGNVQPFFVLILAWVLWRIIPRFASRELFTFQTMLVKVISFSLVFIGMALLATS